MSEWQADRRNAADVAIDRAVREIMSAEPRPGFKLRVFARLRSETNGAANAFHWPWPRIAAAAIGAAAIVFVIIMARPADRRDEPARTAQTTPAPAAPAPVEAPSVVDRFKQPSPSSPATPDIRRTSPIEPRTVRAASLLPLDATESTGPDPFAPLESFAAIEPINVTPLQLPPLPVPQVEIKPLPALDRIAISPLSPPR